MLFMCFGMLCKCFRNVLEIVYIHLRNNLEITDPNSVLDGNIDVFLEAELYKLKDKK